jgi:uncharacterized protein YjiK
LRALKFKRFTVKPQLKTYNCGFTSAGIIDMVSVVLTVILTIACSERQDNNLEQLNPTGVYSLNIPETSDLCFGSNSTILYTVSDNTAKVYKISNAGKILAELQYKGTDPEGICYVGNQFLYLAEERQRIIYKLDLQGNQLDQRAIAVEKNEDNNGLEGISYATLNKHFYIINEKNPGLLIETDENFNVQKNYSLKFSSDYSGICVDNTNQQLWIVCDEAATVNQCTMQGELIKSYHIPVSNPEGIAFDPLSNKLYIVSDAEARLYSFEIKN